MVAPSFPILPESAATEEEVAELLTRDVVAEEAMAAAVDRAAAFTTAEHSSLLIARVREMPLGAVVLERAADLAGAGVDPRHTGAMGGPVDRAATAAEYSTPVILSQAVGHFTTIIRAQVAPAAWVVTTQVGSVTQRVEAASGVPLVVEVHSGTKTALSSSQYLHCAGIPAGQAGAEATLRSMVDLGG